MPTEQSDWELLSNFALLTLSIAEHAILIGDVMAFLAWMAMWRAFKDAVRPPYLHFAYTGLRPHLARFRARKSA